jgi:hypothetical protein
MVTDCPLVRRPRVYPEIALRWNHIFLKTKHSSRYRGTFGGGHPQSFNPEDTDSPRGVSG